MGVAVMSRSHGVLYKWCQRCLHLNNFRTYFVDFHWTGSGRQRDASIHASRGSCMVVAATVASWTLH